METGIGDFVKGKYKPGLEGHETPGSSAMTQLNVPCFQVFDGRNGLPSDPCRRAGFSVEAVTIVVPYPAGGSSDATSRALAQKLSERGGSRWSSTTGPARPP